MWYNTIYIILYAILYWFLFYSVENKRAKLSYYSTDNEDISSNSDDMTDLQYIPDSSDNEVSMPLGRVFNPSFN